MPTYVCSVAAGFLDTAQKAGIARAIARRHSDMTGAPAYLAQVVYDDKKVGDRYLGGKAADRHIWIRGDVRAGRSIDHRKRLALGIMADVARIAGVGEGEVWVYLCSLTPSDMVEYGHVLPEPGEEQAWFESLPKSLQDYLAGLGSR